jgi:hypothetical protein
LLDDLELQSPNRISSRAEIVNRGDDEVVSLELIAEIVELQIALERVCRAKHARLSGVLVDDDAIRADQVRDVDEAPALLVFDGLGSSR